MSKLPKQVQETKKSYASPKLIRHGDMRRLTQGGSNGPTEMDNNGDKKKSRP